jgi:hypothetical protein
MTPAAHHNPPLSSSHAQVLRQVEKITIIVTSSPQPQLSV